MTLRRAGQSAVLLLFAGCPAPLPSDSADTSDTGLCEGAAAPWILGGALDEGDPAVVAVNEILRDPCLRAGMPVCTGTLIAPDRVLTAAHCVQDEPAAAFGVVFGPTADLGVGPVGEGLDGVLFRVVAADVHPDFDLAWYTNDVAVLTLEADAPVEPVPLAADGAADALSGATARVVGYGAVQGEAPYAKRDGTVQITEVGDEIAYAPAPAMTCAGDSGGPLLATVDGVEVLLGVTSRGDAACEERGVAIRVDAVRGFVSP